MENENNEIENAIIEENVEVEVTVEASEIVESKEEVDEIGLTDEALPPEEDAKEDAKEDGNFFTYVLNADNTLFLVSTHITEKEAISQHNEDVSMLYAQHDVLPESEYGTYKKIGSEFFADEEANKQLRMKSRFTLIAEMFSSKNIGLKAIAIGKDEIERDMFQQYSDYVTYVNEQFSSYKEQYENAKNGRYSDSENKAIIAKYEFVSEKIAPVNKLSNEVRSLLMNLASEENEAFDEIFEKVKNLKLSMSDIQQGTAAEKINLFKIEIGVDDGTN